MAAVDARRSLDQKFTAYGKKMERGKEISMKQFDRIAIGGEILRFHLLTAEGEISNIKMFNGRFRPGCLFRPHEPPRG